MIRVKLYVLNENRQWDDKGKGYVSVAPKSTLEPVASIGPVVDSDEGLVETKPDPITEGASDSLSSFTVEDVENVETVAPPAEPTSPIVQSCASGGSDHKEMMIIMKSEADPSVILLQSKIQSDTMYQKQQDTLIVWNSETEGDLALSFEEIKGCTTIYDQIWAYQNEVSEAGGAGSGGEDSPGGGTGSDVTDTGEVNISTVSMGGNESETRCRNISAALNGDLEELLEAGKIDAIRWDFEYQLMNAKYKENVCRVIESEKLIPKMIQLFRRCEEEFFISGLEHLYSIFKNMVSMGKTALYEILFSEACLDDVIGILEYPPGKARQHHRDFIKNATLKEALPIKKEKLLQKIRQTYKVQYIHDVILPTPPIMEEMNLYTLQSFIYLNKAEIVTMIQEDVPFLKAIIAQISKEDSSYEEKKNSFGFFKELCMYSQCLDALKREAFFVFIIEIGILKAIAHILSIEIDELASKEETEGTVQLQWSAVEVFAYFIEVCPNVVREFILTDHRENVSSDETLLINLLMYQMLNDRDAELGGALQVLNLFRIILDFSVDSEDTLVAARHVLDPFSRQLDSKDSFLSMFYSRCVPILITQVLAMTAEPDSLGRDTDKDEYRTALSAQIVLRLLSYCLSHGHGFHIRNYLIKNELIGRFLLLLKSKHVFLVLTALKFIRTIIGLKDDVFNRHVVANKLIQPVVNAYLRNGHKYNLLNSALIEFFDFIKTENMKLLIINIGENYISQFQDVTYVTTFHDLKTRYAQLTDFDKHENGSALGTPIMSTDFSDSENASEKSLQFLSPTIDSAASNSTSSRAYRGGNDWLASENDDDLGEDPSKQLLADAESPEEEAKWMEQWNYHTSQLKKKREQKMVGDESNGGLSVFDPQMFLKKTTKSSTNGSAKPSSLTIAPIKNLPSQFDKIFDEDLVDDMTSQGPQHKMPRTNLDCDEDPDIQSACFSLSPIFPTDSQRASTPTSSLVDYDSDSDDDYAADTEDATDSSNPPKNEAKTVINSDRIETICEKTEQSSEDSEGNPSSLEYHKIQDGLTNGSLSDSSAEESLPKPPPDDLLAIDSSPEVKSCRVKIETASLEDTRLTPKRARECISSQMDTSDVDQNSEVDTNQTESIRGRLFGCEEDATDRGGGDKQVPSFVSDHDSPPKKRTRSVTDSAENQTKPEAADKE